MKELKDTMSMMTSDNYKERFKAEYYQLETRYLKLHRMCENWDNLDFKPTCPKAWYEKQLKAMFDYLNVLGARAVLEDVELDQDEELKDILIAHLQSDS